MATRAFEAVNGMCRTITIPAGAIIKVTSSPKGDGFGLMNVLWEARAVAMFSLDLKARGIEVED